MPRHCWQQGGLGYGRPRLRLGRGRLAATRTRAGRRPSGCAAVADTAAQPPQRRCNLAKLAGPPRQRSPTLPWSKPQQRRIAQLHSPRSSDHRRHKCRIDSIEIYSRVLNSKLRSRSGFVRQWAAPLWPRCAAALGRRCGRFGCCRRGGDWDITGSGRPSGCAAVTVADTAAATWPGRSGRSGRRTTATGNGTAPRGQACFRSLERAAALPVGTCQQHGRMMGP